MKRQQLTFLTLTLSLTLMLGSLPVRAIAVENQVQAADVVPLPLPPNAPAGAVDAGAALTQPAREVAKLATAGVSDDVIRAYIDASSSTFNLTPENIIHLRGVGVSGAITTAMLSHDKAYIATATATAQPPTPVPAPAAQPQVAPQTAPATPTPEPSPAANATDEGQAQPVSSVSVYTIPNRYNDSLSQFGSWGYYGGGYGWGWQPYSWSGFPWGCNFFGSGRWWCHSARGWCWSPGSGIGFRAQSSFIGGSRFNNVGRASNGFFPGGVGNSGGRGSFHR